MSPEPESSAVARSLDGRVNATVYDETGGLLAQLQNDAVPKSMQTPQDWASIVVSTLSGEGIVVGALEVFFVDEQRITDLNLEHMAKQGSTDVLAFPLDGHDNDGQFDQSNHELDLEPVERHLGDVVICPSVASSQALGHAGSLDAEITLLLVHGVLHILGHDHYEPDEATKMRSREKHHLSMYGFPHPGVAAESDQQ